MERFPVLREGKCCGELTAEREGLYTRFSVTGSLTEKPLWCAWVVGERGELRLGVLEPKDGHGFITRRFSGGETAGLGRCLRCELHRAGEMPRVWTAAGNPAELFSAPELRRWLTGVRNVLTCREGERLLLAFPWEKRQPFPLVPLFCFARLECVGGRYCVVFTFDEKCRPVFPK